MDVNALIDEIVRRVADKLGDSISDIGADAKPKLLILTQQHGTLCHKMLECERLNAFYSTECALQMDYQCSAADYEAVILFDLTIDAMCKIAGGICDTPFTALAQQAILCGRKVFVPESAVELYTYASSAPKVYSAMLEQKLSLLQNAGISICPDDQLADAILSGEASQNTAPSSPCSISCSAPPRTGEARIAKRVVTERDIAAVYDSALAVVHLPAGAIVTDLAKEYAGKHGVMLQKDA